MKCVQHFLPLFVAETLETVLPWKCDLLASSKTVCLGRASELQLSVWLRNRLPNSIDEATKKSLIICINQYDWGKWLKSWWPVSRPWLDFSTSLGHQAGTEGPYSLLKILTQIQEYHRLIVRSLGVFSPLQQTSYFEETCMYTVRDIQAWTKWQILMRLPLRSHIEASFQVSEKGKGLTL